MDLGLVYFVCMYNFFFGGGEVGMDGISYLGTFRGGSRISLRGVLLKERVQSAHEIFKAMPTFQRTTPICVRIQWLLQLEIEKLY